MNLNFTNINSNNIINNIVINTYELDSISKESLRNHLKTQVKKIKPIAEFSNYSNPTVKSSFLNRIKEQLAYKKQKQFDKRREFVTEFMAQTLLEKENNIIFWEEVDKKINVDPIEMKKSTDGIDVTGIQLEDNCKFVICEVKASDENKNKVDSSTEILDEIAKASFNNEWRLLDELHNYLYKIWVIEGNNDKLSKLLESLIENIKKDDSSEDIINKNIIFIPFLIRRKRDRIKDFLEIVDYKTLHEKEVSGVIWWFDEDITNFCINLFDEAIEEVL